MVCGLCHREEQNHTLSLSGPTRCKYDVHRENCPGGHRTPCEDHLKKLSENKIAETDLKFTENTDVNTEKLVSTLSSLSLDTDLGHLSQEQLAQLQQLAQLGVQAANANQHTPSNDQAKATPKNETLAAEIKVPIIPTVSTPQTFPSGPPPSTPQTGPVQPTGLPPPSTAPWVGTPHAPPSNGSSFHTLEDLVRQHISNNQQHINTLEQQSAYKGPTIGDIRQDETTKVQVDKVMSAIKQVSPVFNQAAASNQMPLGISPLDQLKEQLAAHQQQGHQHAQVVGGQQPQTYQNVPNYSTNSNLSQQLQVLLSGQLQQVPQYGQPVPQYSQQVPQYGHQAPQYGQLHQQFPQHYGLQQHPFVPPQQQETPSQLTQLLSLLSSAQQAVPPSTSAGTPTAAGILQHLLQNQVTVPQQPTLNVSHQPFYPNLPQQLLNSSVQGQQNQHGLLAAPPVHPQPPLQKSSLQNLQQQQGMAMGRAVHVRPTEYARYCQVDYADKIKAENANLVMFSYGYIREILASRQGLIPPMTDQQLNGRLQHLLHLLEMTAMFSTNDDFSSYAWQRARNYNSRVFSDMDMGTLSWTGIGPKLDPTNMMQAIEAVPRPTKQDKQEKQEKKKPSSEGPPCPRWNSCDTKDKCTYEVENPGRTCNRPHICSFCYNKFGYTNTKHKESTCKKKSEGSQPT